MANRTTLAVLTGLVVGALMGAGAVQYATLTADILVARTYDSYRSQRYNSLQGSPAELRNDGMAGVRSPTSKAATHGAGSTKLSTRTCVKYSNPIERSECLEKLIESYVQENG